LLRRVKSDVEKNLLPSECCHHTLLPPLPMLILVHREGD
jgi:hypothetical protein